MSSDIDRETPHDVVLFLCCFRVPHTLQEVTEVIDWPLLRRWEPEEVVQQFLATNLLEPAGERDPGGMERAAFHRTLLRCTKGAAALVDGYLAHGLESLLRQPAVSRDQVRNVILWILAVTGSDAIGEAAGEGFKALLERLELQASTIAQTLFSSEPEMVYVPAGPFLMGTSDEQIRYLQSLFDWPGDRWFERERPQHTVTLSAFEIGRYPVTNAEFGCFMDDGGYQNRSYWTDAGWRGVARRSEKEPSGWSREAYNAPSQPVMGVSWHEAMAYCNWLRHQTGRSYRLPSEAEWEKAARGTDGRLWPWGNDWDPRCCNSEGLGLCRSTPVGQYSPQGDSPYGAGDMAGSLWDWCADWYGEDTYRLWATSVVRNPQGPGSGECKVWRGGAWWASPLFVRCACRFGCPPDLCGNAISFRVARSLAP